MAEIINSAC